MARNSLGAARHDHARQALVVLVPLLDVVPGCQLSMAGLTATHFGTATSSVSRYSEPSTRSPFFTTSISDFCARFPLVSRQRPSSLSSFRSNVLLLALERVQRSLGELVLLRLLLLGRLDRVHFLRVSFQRTKHNSSAEGDQRSPIELQGRTTHTLQRSNDIDDLAALAPASLVPAP